MAKSVRDDAPPVPQRSTGPGAHRSRNSASGFALPGCRLEGGFAPRQNSRSRARSGRCPRGPARPSGAARRRWPPGPPTLGPRGRLPGELAGAVTRATAQEAPGGAIPGAADAEAEGRADPCSWPILARLSACRHVDAGAVARGVLSGATVELSAMSAEYPVELRGAVLASACTISLAG